MVMKIMVNKFMNYGMYFYYNLVSVMYFDRSTPIVARNSTSFTIKDDVSLGHIFSWIPKCTTTNTFSSKPIHPPLWFDDHFDWWDFVFYAHCIDKSLHFRARIHLRPGNVFRAFEKIVYRPYHLCHHFEFAAIIEQRRSQYLYFPVK